MLKNIALKFSVIIFENIVRKYYNSQKFLMKLRVSFQRTLIKNKT